MTFTAFLSTKNLTADELATDTENVLYRIFETGQDVALDTYRGLDGLLYIRWGG